jgi:hypothetical protein
MDPGKRERSRQKALLDESPDSPAIADCNLIVKISRMFDALN